MTPGACAGVGAVEHLADFSWDSRAGNAEQGVFQTQQGSLQSQLCQEEGFSQIPHLGMGSPPGRVGEGSGFECPGWLTWKRKQELPRRKEALKAQLPAGHLVPTGVLWRLIL